VKRAALYIRVSTSTQTSENQRLQLIASAKERGWQVALVFEDAGISGSKGREKRPGLNAMLNAISRGEIDIVAAWSVDRLGRSLRDLLSVLSELQEKKVDLFLHQQALDTTTSTGRAMFGMLSVFAEFEREVIRERVFAGLARARSEGKRLGRKRLEDVDSKKFEAITTMLNSGRGVRRIASDLHVGVGTVLRVRNQLPSRQIASIGEHL